MLGTGTEDLLTFLVGLGVSSNSRSLAFSASSGSLIAFLSLIAEILVVFYAKNVHNNAYMVTEGSTQTVIDLEELTEEEEEEEASHTASSPNPSGGSSNENPA